MQTWTAPCRPSTSRSQRSRAPRRSAAPIGTPLEPQGPRMPRVIVDGRWRLALLAGVLLAAMTLSGCGPIALAAHSGSDLAPTVPPPTTDEAQDVATTSEVA